VEISPRLKRRQKQLETGKVEIREMSSTVEVGNARIQRGARTRDPET
jgi:hypothetical protein